MRIVTLEASSFAVAQAGAKLIEIDGLFINQFSQLRLGLAQRAHLQQPRTGSPNRRQRRLERVRKRIQHGHAQLFSLLRALRARLFFIRAVTLKGDRSKRGDGVGNQRVDLSADGHRADGCVSDANHALRSARIVVVLVCDR